ncbi:redox-sensing transcriptional repressor Rex [Haloglycomyces albus]|uniref:redox-sensing transcriptional repressor Rex n=1 Tax=Haloglycomyces albus TaxID=526067 RepID=UPI00046D2B72|nr:redox-sensing transcriptional repressor Rex [Haloglycomyces albus]
MATSQNSRRETEDIAPTAAFLPDQSTDAASLPTTTVNRLPEYLRALRALADDGVETVSSDRLSTDTGVSPALLRKDLSLLGASGRRGIGYDVTNLTVHLLNVLGLTRISRVALIGMGHLGQALARYPGFRSRGFHIIGAFDSDPAVVGKRIPPHTVRDVRELPEAIDRFQITIGVITTPEHAAQRIADMLVKGGVTSILNFAPCLLSVPEGVAVRKVDLAVELQLLSFHEHHKNPETVRQD